MLDMFVDKQITYVLSLTHRHSPGIPAVEAEGDLVHTAWVSHHQVKTRLKQKERTYKELLPASRELTCLNMQETCLFILCRLQNKTSLCFSFIQQS